MNLKNMVKVAVFSVLGFILTTAFGYLNAIFGMVASTTIGVMAIIWSIINLLKPYLGDVFIGSIYTLLLIMIKFFPIFILGRVLSLYSSSRLLASFRKIGVGGSIGIGISLFFRFVPEISIRLKEINTGMKIRGFKPSILRPLRTFELYFVPLIYKCIDISDTLTCSIILKGIEYRGEKTTYHEVKFTLLDIMIFIIGIVLAGVSIWTKF